jgi:sodium/pantothenate symporter
MVFAGWISVALYISFILYVVIGAARRTKDMASYAVGNFQFSPAVVGLSLAAAMTSAATFIINPGFVAYYGLSGVLSMAVFLPLGSFFSLIMLSKGFRKIGNTVKAYTLAQWVGARYESKGMAFLFAVLSLLLITFIVLICVGLTQVLSITLQTDPLYTLIAIVIFTFGYMMFGGANSMVYTNFLQALLKVVVAFLLLGSGYTYFAGGWADFLARLNAIDPNLTSAYNPESPLFRDFFEVVICQLIVGVAVVCQPHIITRSLMLKKDSDVNRYLTFAIVVLTLFFFVVFTGLYARLAFPDLQVNGKALRLDATMSTYIATQFSPITGLLMMLGLLSAGLATLEGLIQSLSITITSDLIKPLLGGKLPLSEIIMNRLVIVFLGIVAIFISYKQITHPDLSVGIFAQNGVYAYFAAMFVPILFGTFLKNVPAIVPTVSAIIGLMVHFSVYYGRLTPYMATGTRNPGIAAALAIIAAVGVGGILQLILSSSSSQQSKK